MFLCYVKVSIIVAVDGMFFAWSGWSQCSTSCGGGQQKRTRSCNNPSPSKCGKNCVGDTEEVVPCNTQPCSSKIFYCSHGLNSLTDLATHPIFSTKAPIKLSRCQELYMYICTYISSQFFENQPNEICSHLSEKASEDMFLKPEKLQNHSDERKGKKKKKEKKKSNSCTLRFYNYS